ncbi:MAG: BACON domain-containing carbohydrate-binding protein [Burkholderiales bacterium]
MRIIDWNHVRAAAAIAAIALSTLSGSASGAALAPQPLEIPGAGRFVLETPNVIPLPDGMVGTAYSINLALYWSCATNPNPVFAFTWTPANPVPGLTFPTNGSISGTPTTAGAYTAPGTVTDVSGLSGACGAPASFTYSLNVLPRPPVCTVSASNPNPGINTNITLTASCTNSPTSYNWSGCTSTTSTCTTTSTTAGSRTYSVSGTNTGGTGAAASVTVNWVGPPNCSVSSSNNSPFINTNITLTASCSGSPTSYAWTGCTSTTSTCTTSSATAGARTYSVVGSNVGGAGNTAQVTVTWVVPVPTCTLNAPASAQVGTNATLTANCTNNPTSFNWTGCTTSGATCVTGATTPGTRTYGVSATNGAGTGPQATAQILWVPSTNPVCTPSASDPNPAVGSTITIAANCTNSPTSYTWTGCTSTGATCPATSTAEGARTYTVTATNASGTGTGTVTVTWRSGTGGNPGNAVVGASSGGGGSGFSALIRDSGTLWTWGDNSQSGLGDGSSTSRSTPGQVAGLANIKAATVGSAAHTLALDKSGTVWAWGTNTYGEIGNGTKSPQTRPIAVPLPYPAAAVAAGSGFSLALLQNGLLYAWGRNNLGQLGDGSGADQLSPVQVTGVSGITSIAASGNHAAAVAGGFVYVWGGSFYVAPNQSARPVQVPLLANVLAVYAGGDNTFALRTDGTLWAFGNPADGRLGNGGDTDGKTPVQVRTTSGPLAGVAAVAAGDSVSMALLNDGSLMGWGKNDRGQLGLGHMNTVQYATKLTLTGNAAIANAAAGPSNYVVDAKGRMYAAGSNERGSLGLGDTVETRAPAVVPGLAAITAVAATPSESLALRSDGIVLSWGSADASLALTSTAAPRAVPGLAGRYVSIAGGSQTAVAVRDDGAVFAWGPSVPGSSTSPVASPVALTSLAGARSAASGGLGVIALTAGKRALIACGKAACPGTDFGFTDVIAVAAGESHFLVLRADKSVWAWGANDKGQLGNGGTLPSSAPVRVTGLSNIRGIVAGADFSVAFREDGQAFAWGQAPSFVTFKSTPVRVSGLDDGTVVAAASHVLAIDGAGRGKAWGRGSKVGERDHLAPGREPRMDGMKALAAGVNHSLGVTTDGKVIAWGRNFQQQLAVPRSQALANFVEVSDQANAAFTQGALPVVEFQNPAIAMGGKTNLTHFFMTAYPDEINGLDTGSTVKGWQRTGRSWRAWPIAAAGGPSPGTPAAAKPVYRFFSSRWNSHFYTAVEAEKNELLAKNPTQDDTIDWKLESVAFYAMAPDGGCPALSVLPRSKYLCTDTTTPAARDCPAGYYPIYRAFDVGPTSTRPDPNHQFTASWVDIYRNVRFAGYVYEGVAFCAPVSTQPGGDLQAYHTYPGDKAEAGKPMQSEFWFGNAGPGNADKAVLVAALPANGGNWTATCRAFNGATCPADLSIASLRQGVEAPALPAGGVVHITAVGTAPSQATTLGFTSSIGAPSGAPDPFANNNAAPVTETAVIDGTCNVTLSAKSLALLVEGASASVLVDAPAACAWSIASDQSWASVTPASGTGPVTVKVVAAPNSDASERLATITVNASAQITPIEVRQPGVPVALPCPSLSLGRLSDIIGGNAVANRVNVVTPTNCAWQASTSDPWLAIAAMNAVGTGQIEYVVQPNPDGSNGRTGTIVVTAAGKTLHVLTVTQSAGNGGSDQGGTGGGSDGGPGGDGGDGGGDGAGE